MTHFHEPLYDKQQVLQIINHVIGRYQRISASKVKDGYAFKDKYGNAQYSLEGVLSMAETIIEQQKITQ